MYTNQKPKFKAISLFSGCGGMDVGVMQAGFELLACVEMDPFPRTDSVRSRTLQYFIGFKYFIKNLIPYSFDS